MDTTIEKVLARFVTRDFTIIDAIAKQLQIEKSKIIEIIGDSGSGKSLVLKKLIENLDNSGIQYESYLPRIFKYNHFREIVKLSTGIDNKIFDNLIEQSQKFNFKNIYDLFYFLTEKMNEEKLLKPKNIIVYEGCHLDNYTLEFIQYLIQYSTKIKIQVIIFTRKETFSISQKINIPVPRTEEIRLIIKSIYPEVKANLKTESQIVENISGGNLFILNYVLENAVKKEKTFDFKTYIDKKPDIKTIYLQKIGKLNEEQKKILLSILLFDTNATTDNLKKIINPTVLSKGIKELLKEKLIFILDTKYFVKKATITKDFFLSLPVSKRKKIYQPIIDVLPENITNDICIFLNICKQENYEGLIAGLQHIKDFETLVKIYQIFLEKLEKPEKKVEILKQFGIANKRLGKIDDSIENFREALKISVENSIPHDDVVLSLANSLYAINSSAFALEILKKHIIISDDKALIIKIALLKTEILLIMDNIEESREMLEEAFNIVDQIKDINVRSNLKAECKKAKGKFYYYQAAWSKARTEFEDAEKLYEKVNNPEGLAAIYNNLGVLAMQQGDIKDAETLYFKSLEYEKQCFNLSGISVCYINMGSLFEDKNDYKKSIHYLNKALEIQKLLNDNYKTISIYINIGVSYMNNGHFKEAEEAFTNSLTIALKFNMHNHVVTAINNLGAVFFKSGNFQKAIHYYEDAIKKSKDYNFLDGLIKSYNNMGELFETRGEYNIAFDYYSKSKELLPNISDEFMKAELYGNLGSILTALHKFKEAYPYLVESFDFFKNIGSGIKIIEGAEKQAFYFMQTRNYESANYYLDFALQLAEESSNEFHVGKCHFLRSILEKKDPELALTLVQSAIEIFVKTKHDFDLAMANYEFASLLLDKDDWEQALEILLENKKIIEKFEAIKFLEKNDILIQKINKKYAIELKESRVQETLLNKFYEITQELNDISDFDVLLDTSLDRLVEFADADGGIFTLYHNQLVKDSWDYLILKNFTNTDKDFQLMMEVVEDTFNKGTGQNHKQPHFAPEYNNIISFPLIVRNDRKGVICLFTKHGSHYFTERMYNLVNALCNQIVVIVENISYDNLQKSHEIIREELAASSTFTNIIGKSEKIQHIFRMIEKIKNSPTTILVEGESGTGKELIARAIHYNSNRRNKQFVAQYCGALPETLLESELFGHIKGSFTGATHDKKGLFEIADGGTFFLDEIADISLSTQAKLLRFLQEGELKRVGSTQTQKVDVRVICATNVSLKEKVEHGTFRLDLFYRLNVIRIEIPSLKERKSDIPLLAVHFLDKYCQKMEKKVNGLTEEAMRYLMNYDWPGNIRQLENELERAVTLSEDDSSIKSSDLSEEIFRFQEQTESINLLQDKSLKIAVESLEKQMIKKVLDDNEWNQTKAARALGLSRQGLIKKMQRYKFEK